MATQLPDIYLWKQLKKDDHHAFETIYRRHYPALYRFALRFYPNNVVAEQSIQELFIRIWERRSHIAEVDSPKAYLFTALRRELLQQKKKITLPSIAFTPSMAFVYSPQDIQIQQEEESLRHAELVEALNTLPVRQREAVYLKYYEELSYQEVSRIMGINYQSVVNLIFRAFSSLKTNKQLQHYAQYYRLVPITCLLTSIFI
uniref:RNA polymerase sigma factor n=1 Tax=Roseihalotalea indica TaxID=2867963 RepID=A0AA49JDQ4_9BACT|nr:RNA polymerase sigma factor [Tunicatimonas sp. TK19036]